MKRIEWIDNAKGILIVLVVIGHICAWLAYDTYPMKWIYAFHMPAFFAVSGVLYRYSAKYRRPIGESVLKLARQLLVPCVGFELFGYLFDGILFGFHEDLFTMIMTTVTEGFHYNLGWYLITLFAAEVLLILTLKATENIYVLYGLCVISFLSACFIPVTVIMRVCTAYLFLLLGYLMKPYFESPNHLAAFVCLAVLSYCAYRNVRVDLNNGVLGSRKLFLPGALCGTYFIIYVSHYIRMSWFGRHSLTIMGVHLPLMDGLRKFLETR